MTPTPRRIAASRGPAGGLAPRAGLLLMAWLVFPLAVSAPGHAGGLFKGLADGVKEAALGPLPPDSVRGMSYDEIRALAGYECEEGLRDDPEVAALDCVHAATITDCEELARRSEEKVRGNQYEIDQLIKGCSRQIDTAQGRKARIERLLAERENKLKQEAEARAEREAWQARLAATRIAKELAGIDDGPLVSGGLSLEFSLKSLLGCMELRHANQGYRVVRQGRDLQVQVIKVSLPAGDRDIGFTFVENPDYWYLRELRVHDFSARTYQQQMGLIVALLAEGC